MMLYDCFVSHHTTTFTTGNGNTIHITRTVIGGDGSVRREMRFRTPAAPSNAEPNPRPTARVQPTSRPPPPNNTSNRYTFILLFVCSEGTGTGNAIISTVAASAQTRRSLGHHLLDPHI